MVSAKGYEEFAVTHSHCRCIGNSTTAVSQLSSPN